MATSRHGVQEAATTARHRATFLLEVALDAERVKQRLADRLVAERDRRHLIQQEMAAFLGVSYRQYQRLENAQSMPRWRNLQQIADALGIAAADLIADDEAALDDVWVSPDVGGTPTRDEEVRTLQAKVAELGDKLDEVLRLQREQNARARQRPA